MNCQNCGAANEDAHVFCERCGAVIYRPRRIDESSIRLPKADMLKAVSGRNQTDRVIPVYLIFVPLIVLVVVMVISVIASMSTTLDLGRYREFPVFAIGTAVPGLLYAVIFYFLIKRQNEHTFREREFRSAVMSVIGIAADTPDRQRTVSGDLYVMSVAHSHFETHRVAWFWALMAALPSLLSPTLTFYFALGGGQGDMAWFFATFLIVMSVGLVSLVAQLYMLFFLGETIADHDKRWVMFATSARTALAKLGFPPGRAFKISRLPQRSLVLYLVLTIFTGIFLYYWIYALTKDPNEHFRTQWGIEDNFVSSIAPEVMTRIR